MAAMKDEKLRLRQTFSSHGLANINNLEYIGAVYLGGSTAEMVELTFHTAADWTIVASHTCTTCDSITYDPTS